jgi:hypothetical protein
MGHPCWEENELGFADPDVSSTATSRQLIKAAEAASRKAGLVVVPMSARNAQQIDTTFAGAVPSVSGLLFTCPAFDPPSGRPFYGGGVLVDSRP